MAFFVQFCRTLVPHSRNRVVQGAISHWSSRLPLAPALRREGLGERLSKRTTNDRLHSIAGIGIRQRLLLSFQIVVALLLCCTAIDAVDSVDEQTNPRPAEEMLPEADQMVFVHQLLRAVEEGDRETANNLIDWNEMIATATAGEDSPHVNRVRNDFKTGFLGAVNKPDQGGFTNTILNNTKNGGSLTFLRLATFENEQVALLRMKSANQAMSYQRYFLKRSKDGVVRAHDIHQLTTAERMSDSIHRVWLSALENSSKTFWDRLLKPVDPVLASLKPLSEMTRLNREGQFERSLEVYGKLPEKLQSQKLLLLARLMAAQNLTSEEYEAAIDDFRKFHPHDPSLDFFLIDGYVLKKEFDKCLKCIERTEESLGGDSWLVSLRGSVLAQAGRYEEATDAAHTAIDMEPDFKDLYLNALAIALAAKNNTDIARHLTELESIFGEEIADLTEIPDYEDFVESPEYQKWMESRK
jgi:tetratricopeptide (TPR) repeat protein